MKISEKTPFNDALEDLRISGSVLLHETYAASWVIEIPSEQELQSLLGVNQDVRILPFHLVRHGSFDLDILHPQQEEQTSDSIGINDLAICPTGMPHRMSLISPEMPPPKPISLIEIIQGHKPTQAKQGNMRTELICGVFQLRNMPFNPLLAAMPPILKVKTDGDNANPMLVHATQMLVMELTDNFHGSFTASRVLEVFCAEALRSYYKQTLITKPGWFNALNDERISQAITHIHQQPGYSWTVALLAKKINMSPSRFSARFREVTNQSVMSYVARWRMNVACRLLKDSEDSLTTIANKIGYTDLAAFSRAFKDLVGNSPAKWRVQQRKKID